VQHFGHQSRAQLGQFGGQLTRRLVASGRGHLGQHRPGVEPRFHPHYGDARLLVARQYRALDGGRSAPARQQAGMNVEAAVDWRIEHRLRQDQAIGRDHRHVSAKRGECGLLLRAPQRRGMPDRNAQFLRAALHRRRLQSLAPSGRARRLGIDAGQLMPRCDQRIQRRDGKFRRSHENYAHVTCFPLPWGSGWG